jgi:hypothetical protein
VIWQWPSLFLHHILQSDSSTEKQPQSVPRVQILIASNAAV